MIDISKHISELLYENDTVALPGLGSFISAYKNAGIDVVLGILSPPSRQLDFNPYLTLDDGILASRLAEQHRLSLEEASSLIETFIANIQHSLAARELVLLPEIGKLYLDFQGALQFLPDNNTNYNLEVFGLPQVKYYPIFRSRESKVMESLSEDLNIVPELPYTSTVLERKFFSLPVNYKQLAIPSAAVFILTVSLAAWLWVGSSESNNANSPFNLKVSQLKVNEKPSVSDDGIGYQELPPIPADPELKATPDQNIEEPKGDDHYLDKEKKETLPLNNEEAASIASGEKAATIIIGSFRDKSNIRKLVTDIISAGYDVYQEKAPNGLTRVGVQLAYSKNAELNRHLGKIRFKFNKAAFVQK